jgi:hypothetical protein
LYFGRRDATAFGDLSDTLALAAVVLDGSPVECQRLAADLRAFKPDAPHAGAHPLDDQAAFQLGDAADDGSAQWSSGTVVISVPWAAVVALKALCSLTSTLIFARFNPVPFVCLIVLTSFLCGELIRV